MKRPQFWYVPPCCRRFRAPAPSPPACASRPPSPPRPLWRSGPSGTLSGGKGGSHRQPPFGRTAHLRLCARGQFRLFAPARVSPFPSRGSRAAARKLAGVRRAAARRQPSNHPSIAANHRGSGLRAVGGRGAGLRAAARFGLRPLPPARLRALRPAPPVCVRSARARNPAPLRARVGVFLGWRRGRSPLVPAPRSRRGRLVLVGAAAAPQWACSPPVASAQLRRRRGCVGSPRGAAGSAGARGFRGSVGSRPPPRPSSATSAACGGRGSGAVPPSFARRFDLSPAGRVTRAPRGGEGCAPLRSYTELTIPGHGSV